MKPQNKIAVFLLALLSFFVLSAEEGKGEWNVLDILPGAWFLHGNIENYQPEATLLTEESNGFALLDRPWIYFDGQSPRALHWELNEVSFASRLNSGAPVGFLPLAVRSTLHLLPGSAKSLQRGVIQKPFSDGRFSSFSLQTVSANLGSFSDWAQFLISTPATERSEMLYETRRRFKGHVLLDGQWRSSWGEGNELVLSLSHNSSSRRFNDWNTVNSQFLENADLTSFYSEYNYRAADRSAKVWLLINRLDRDRLGAELGVLPQETLTQVSTSWYAGTLIQRWGWQLSLSLGQERAQKDSNTLNFSKELMDNDGDLIFSQTPFGLRRSFLFNGRFQPQPETKQVIKPFLDWQISSLEARDDMHRYNPLTLGGNPYGVIIWQGERSMSYGNQLYKARAGLMLELPLLKGLDLAVRAETGPNGFAGSSLAAAESYWGFGVHGALSWRWNDRSELSLSTSRSMQAITPELVDFLDNGQPSGSWYRWSDRDGDRQYDPGEETDLLRGTGGGYHGISPTFTLPVVEQIQVYLALPLSQRWRFELRGTGRQIRNPWTVRYAEAYGHWQTIMGQEVYLLDRPVAEYILTNLEEDRQRPQYWQLMFRFSGEQAEKWYFSFSFMAHMGLGETPFGNGPYSNDSLAVSESSADPNSWINNYGRLDGDRAFVAKLAYALQLSRRLSIGISARYRDGNPFAFLSAGLVSDQLIMRHETLKGEDQHGNKLGPREDYVSEVNLKLSYRLPLFGGTGRLSLEWFNLIDVGYELSEYVFATSGRPPMELTLPRSIRLSLVWQGR